MQDIYSYIRSEESAYQTIPAKVIDGYEWLMSDHIKKSVFYKNSQYLSGKSDNKPYKNIMRPILNLQYRAEGFDVKDIVLFINDKINYFKSFLVRKFHDKWARENEIDTFIDEMVESYVDFGGALVKNVNTVRPEVVPLQRLAFCDQTDILSGPICEKHFYSPDQLKEMSEKGWENIDEVIALAENYKKDTTQSQNKETKTPGKYIEIYEIHGMFPKWWLEGYDDGSDGSKEYVRQLHICTFYIGQDRSKHGITLYKGKEKELPYKLILRDKIYGRALGFGGAEELFEPQVWVNYDIIRMKGMLDAASKVIYQTADTAFANRNKTMNLDNGEILVYEENKPIAQINTQPVNIRIFENSVAEWEAHARQMGAATESIMGEQPASGTPFKLQELITAESHSLHEYRKGKLATFIDEVYRDWIIPYISREITKGQEFIAELDLEELQSVADSLVINESNKKVKEKILNGELIYPEEVEAYKQTVKDEFMKAGSKRFIEILKGEMKNAPIDVFVNVAGKQKDLAGVTDKLVNVFRQMLSTYNPQTGSFAIFDDPRMSKVFNEILESSNLSPIDFYQKPKQITQVPQKSIAGTAPVIGAPIATT